MNIIPRHRGKKMMPWLLVEFIWRRKHHSGIFDGIIKVLKDVAFSRAARNPAWLTEFSSENISNNQQ